MKQKNKQNQKNKVILATIALLVLLILIISITAKNRLNKIAQQRNTISIGGIDIDISKVITPDPNAPHITAGMIPIEWDEESSKWVISDGGESWYDYSSGKWANVMLSDGIYSSELERGKLLASDFVGTSINNPEDLGTIFTWIPRLCYLESEEGTRVEFLKNTSVLEYMFTTPNCFNLAGQGANKKDIAFTGIWVAKEEISTKGIQLEEGEELTVEEKALEQKINQMNSIDNPQGLIKNAQVNKITESDKKVVEKLTQKYNIEPNQTMIQDIDKIQYRETIKVVNTNNLSPIKYSHTIKEGNIVLNEIHLSYPIEYILDEQGNEVKNKRYELTDEKVKYIFYIIDNQGNIKKYQLLHRELGLPDMTGLNKNTTFYVTYDANGNETSVVPIGEKRPTDWYNYEESKWANIVIRDQGQVNYFVWIPRYMYILNQETQSSEVKFVDLDNCWMDEDNNLVELGEEWKLPEAFTWNEQPIWGYWIAKFKLREDTGTTPQIMGGAGKINIMGVATNSSYTYELYLIHDGKRVTKGEDGNLIENPEPYATINGNYTIKGIPEGTYGVNIVAKNSSGQQVEAIEREVEVMAGEGLEPDLTGFNKATTFYVIYDESGQEINNIPIGEEIPDNWYDYDNQKWANIVIRENGKENYFVWIPRYEYVLNDTEQRAEARIISKDQTEADPGYQIPDAFTWNGQPIAGYWIAKFKLRDDTNVGVNATVNGSGEKITISNVTNNTGSTITNYEIMLINEEGKIIKTETKTSSAIASGYTFTNIDAGIYTVTLLGKAGTTIVGGITQEVVIVEEEQPSLVGFNVDCTYIVAYNSSGTEYTYLLKNILEEGAQISESRQLISGKVDKSKITTGTWYEYGAQKWANIVIKDNGKENYFVWIPRYEYVLNNDEQNATVRLIPTSKETPDSGYQIPDAFTWNGKAIPGYWIAKFKLRE